MIERIIEASARNKFLIFIFTVFAIAGGVYGLSSASVLGVYSPVRKAWRYIQLPDRYLGLASGPRLVLFHAPGK